MCIMLCIYMKFYIRWKLTTGICDAIFLNPIYALDGPLQCLRKLCEAYQSFYSAFGDFYYCMQYYGDRSTKLCFIIKMNHKQEKCENHIKAGFFNVIIQNIAVHWTND